MSHHQDSANDFIWKCVQHLPETLALEDLAYAWTHGLQLWIGLDDLVDNLRVRHDARHLLHKLG